MEGIGVFDARDLQVSGQRWHHRRYHAGAFRAPGRQAPTSEVPQGRACRQPL